MNSNMRLQIKSTPILQGRPVVAQQMGSDTCCVVTASHFCTSVVSFHSHPQPNSRSEGGMSKSWCTSRQIMLRWFTVAEVLQLPVTITRISGVPFTYLRNCNSTCKVILFRYVLFCMEFFGASVKDDSTLTLSACFLSKRDLSWETENSSSLTRALNKNNLQFHALILHILTQKGFFSHGFKIK